MFDCHVHTQFSTDSKMNIEDALKKASDLDMGLILTEHMDLKYPIGGKFIFNPEEYFKAYSRYRKNNLLLGVEMGIRVDCFEENKKLADSYQFDYIIGSVHVVDNIDIYESIFYDGRGKKTVYSQYLTAMLESIKTHDFIDCLGHIDYIARYARFDDKELYYGEFSDEIDEILKVLIKKEKAIEINTRRIGEPKVVEALIQIYKRYYELGGRIVTIGSDSHIPEHIGENFGVAKDMADRCNLKIVYYRERKPYFL